MSQLRTIAWETNSQITEDVLWRGVVSSTVFYVVRTKNIKQVRDIFLQGFKKTEQNRTTKKKQISTYTVGQYDLGTWKGSLIMEGVPALVSQKGRHLIFIFNMDNLYFWSMCPFL